MSTEWVAPAAVTAAAAATVLPRLPEYVRWPREGPGLRPSELARLRSSDAAVITALAELRARGEPATDTDEFTRAVHTICVEQHTSDMRRIRPAATAALHSLDARLAARGYLTAPRIRHRVLRTAPHVVIAGAGAIGGLMLFVGARSGWFILGGVALALYSLFRLITGTKRLWSASPTAAARRLLASERARFQYLDPVRRPAWATYGVDAVALSAALFGVGALWQFDNVYTIGLHLPVSAEIAGTSIAGSGSGCGGGGCGSGCGGCGG